MQLSPLQLVGYRLLDIKVTSRMSYDPEKDDSEHLGDELEARLDIAHEEDADTAGASFWTVILDLKYEGEPDQHVPYDFQVALLAEFFCAKSLPANLDAETIVGINGTSLAYGIARELIHTLTEKSMWGGLTLPTMTFSNFRELLAPEQATGVAGK